MMPAPAAPALTTALRESLFLRACRREPVERTPVWLMRQAGRYMKDYRDLRAKKGFLEICADPDLVAEVTVGAQRKLGVDAAILFADILLPVDAFGLGLSFVKGDGPRIARPVRSRADAEALPEAEPETALAHVMEGVRRTRRALAPDVPLLGFAGAPFTVASYMIEGGPSQDFERTKRFLHAGDGGWETLMEKLSRATARYLNAQIAAGAQAVQLFDSWAGCLERREYEDHVLRWSQAVIRALPPGVPVIHFGTGTGAFLDLLAEAGGDVIGVDHRIRLADAWQLVGENRGVQGNLDPLVLCSSLDNVRTHARAVLEQAAGRPGHIFNLGHGVLPDTPVAHAVALVEMVKEMSAR